MNSVAAAALFFVDAMGIVGSTERTDVKRKVVTWRSVMRKMDRHQQQQQHMSNDLSCYCCVV